MSRQRVKRSGVVACALVGVCAMASAAWAGPWTKGQGEAYVKGMGLMFGSDTFVSSTGARVQGADFVARTGAVYAEGGVGGGVQLQMYLPYQVATNRFEELDTTYANVGFGDAIVGVQWTPVRLDVPWAVRLDAKVPLYDVAGIEGPEAARFPAFGDGQLDATLWASIGGSFYPLPAYALLEVGYRHRTEVFPGAGNGLEFGDGVTFFGQVGYTLFDVALVGVNTNGVVPLVEDTVTQGFVTVGPMVAVTMWQELRLEATYDWMPWSVNNAPGATASLGVSYTLR